MILNWKLNAFLGFCLWGLWTLWVNYEAGLASAILSAITQGTISAASVSSLALAMNYFMQLKYQKLIINIIMASLIPYLSLLSIIVSAHIIVNTHDIVTTILPSASIGIVYVILYIHKSTALLNSDKSTSTSPKL